ncbi:MAG: hypothetical protein EBU57_12365 [Alphaproteobacteria bacterium]|nr:hypothetical protein [Alphaproteobacteria bacterium]
MRRAGAGTCRRTNRKYPCRETVRRPEPVLGRTLWRAIPVATTLSTAYNDLATGVASGFIMFPGVYFGFKFHEPAPHFKITNHGAMEQNVLNRNLNTWGNCRKTSSRASMKARQAMKSWQSRILIVVKQLGLLN